MDLSREIGRALRRVRMARGMTLRTAARQSGSRFKPSSIAGYERGERAITVQRFCDLAEVYGAEPPRLLAGIIAEAQGRPAVQLDLSALDRLDLPEAATLRSFVDRVREVRGAPVAEALTLRDADLEVIARAAGREPDELLELLEPARRPS